MPIYKLGKDPNSKEFAMPNQVFWIQAAFDDEQRSRLLDAFPPLFKNIYCRQMIWAYNVPDDFVWPQEPLTMTVTGHHVGDGHEALVLGTSCCTSPCPPPTGCPRYRVATSTRTRSGPSMNSACRSHSSAVMPES
jgi:hypothetical protein